jgi:hypothetical protein
VALAAGNLTLAARLLDETISRDPGWRTPREMRARLSADASPGALAPERDDRVVMM